MFANPKPKPFFSLLIPHPSSLTPHPSPPLPSLHYFPPKPSPHPKPIMTKGGNNSKWLLKTEPSEWSWSDQRSNGGVSQWDGVRNRQAVNHLKSMRPHDLCFFYHSGKNERRIVGVVKVVKPWYLIGDGEIDGAVDVKEVGEMKHHVELKEIKKAAEKEKELKSFALLRQPRLSVVPVSDWIWEKLCEMGGGFDNDDQEMEE